MESFANSKKSWSRLRTATAFTFTGLSPAASAASMPARVSSKRPVRVISWNCTGSRVSSEMLTRESPAAFKSPIIRGRSTPLVVMETFSMPSMPVMASTSSTTPLAHQRLAAREANRADAEPGGHGHQPLDLLDAQDLVMGHRAHALLGHAVDAAEIAAIRQRYAQIIDSTTV